MPRTVRDTQAMLAGMTPVLTTGVFVFCCVERDRAATLYAESEGVFQEEEGTTLVLPLARAETLGFDTQMPMRRIVLEVYSALDGVGLTAGVATALADEAIPCNVVAAYHHDHVFVPEEMAEKALSILQALQRRAKAGKNI